MSAADTLKSYVPAFVFQSRTFQAVYGIQGKELDKLDANVSDIVNQCFIDTATWGLKYWEKFLDIMVDESKDVNYRRGVIKSRIRGMGSITVAVIKSIAESYGSEAEVIEYPSEYRFLIRFRGTPPNFIDLNNTIEEIKPAHLAWNFIYIMPGMMSFGGANVSGESGRILPDISDEIKTQGLLTAGSAEKSGESAVVYPQVEDTVTSKGQLIMACFLKIGEHAKITS